MDPSEEFKKLKDQGNQLFTTGNHAEALDVYKSALKLAQSLTDEQRATIFKNIAAACLKLNQFKDAVEYASKALEIYPNDVKALFRRLSAYEELQLYDEAFKDAVRAYKLEPKNKTLGPVLERLNKIVQSNAKEKSSLHYRVKSMVECVSSDDTPTEKLTGASNNLLVLAKEKSGTDLILKMDGLSSIKRLLSQTHVHVDVKLSLVRVLSEMSKHEASIASRIYHEVPISLLLDFMIDAKKEECLTAAQYAIQVMLNKFSGVNPKQNNPSNPELRKQYLDEIDGTMETLIKKCSSRVISGPVRDALLELVAKNVDREMLDWGLKVVSMDLLPYLLDVAAQLEEVKYESSMEITGSTRPHVALVLERCYDCMNGDLDRQTFSDAVKMYIHSKLVGLDIENKVSAVAVITTLLQGPVDVGNQILAQEGIIKMMLVMADAGSDEVQQRVAAEAIIAAASKKDKCTSIASMGSNILKKLYQSPNDNIKVRALVGMCKLGSVGGTDAAFKVYSDTSMNKLTSACKKFLLNPSKDKDLKKWACEGLAYLSLDADIKEDIVSDTNVVNALVALAKTGDLSVLYGTVTTFVNLTNSYDKQEIIPEMIQLAKFAKQHVPEEHIKDKKEFVEKRCRILAKNKVTTALVALAKTESKTSREMISRILNAICEYQDLRGLVVQDGGTKVLLDMATNNNTGRGKVHASQALARIGITINPEVAFPGQRVVEVVRPLMSLLEVDCSALQNFEALMALTNLAQVSQSVQVRILKDNGFSKIEHYVYEEHELIRRSALQCVSNLILNPDVVRLYEGDNDRVKYLVVMSEEEDVATAKAASGALAMITSVSQKSCEKVFDAKNWFPILLMLLSSKDKEFQLRGAHIVNNIIQADKACAEKIVETNLLEVLMALVRPEVDDVDPKVKELANSALDKLNRENLIKSVKPTVEENEDTPD